MEKIRFPESLQHKLLEKVLFSYTAQKAFFLVKLKDSQERETDHNFTSTNPKPSVNLFCTQNTDLLALQKDNKVS